jgi:ParB family transcriptional regulator, chromosome partitioning protein
MRIERLSEQPKVYKEAQMRLATELNKRKLFPEIEQQIERPGEKTKDGKPKSYIPDLWFKGLLVVEIDGDAHDFAKDAIRDKWLIDNGHAKKVLHFENDRALRHADDCALEVQEGLDDIKGADYGKISEEYLNLVPPMLKADHEALFTSIKDTGQHFPIVMNAKRVILDGHNRYLVCRALGIWPKYEIKDFENHWLERRFVIESNLNRRHLLDYQKAELGIPLLEIERELAKQRQGVRKDLKEPTSSSIELEVKKVEQARDLVAKRIGLSPTTFERAKKVIEEGSDQLKDSVRQGKRSISNAYDEIQKPKTKQESVFVPKIFNVWSFSAPDDRFGMKNYPGRTPGQIMQNILYYWTEKGGLVIDPMAGGGTMVDVANFMGRKCLAYDLEPVRKDIHFNNIRNGLPDKTVGCNLVFLDPPYWGGVGQQPKGYTKKEGALSNMSAEEYMQFLNVLAKECYRILADKGVVALLHQDQTDIMTGMAHFFVADILPIFREVGFTVTNHIQAPLTTQMDAYMVSKAKEERRVIDLARDIYIFRK